MRSSRWLVLAALIAAGCGGSSGGSSDNGGGNGKPIKIGASLPLTGDFSEPGKAAQQGYKVWESLTNSKGGLLGRKVQIVIKDDASNQNTVVADYNALIANYNKLGSAYVACVNAYVANANRDMEIIRQKSRAASDEANR